VLVRFKTVVWLLGMLLSASLLRAASPPGILITNLPAYGSFDSLDGLVLNADPARCRIAVFIYVPGAGWWSKPSCSAPLTPIQPNGTWTADITTGGSDELATRVAALLVNTNYSEDCVQGLSFIPTNVFARALASAVVTRSSPGKRWLNFSGYDWRVKSSAGRVGPGPNYFSDSTNNVWVDALGQLHVRVTNRSNQWQCAELVSARTFGCGSYRFELNSRVDNLDPNIVLGLFTWSDDPVFAYREIDVECSRFGVVGEPSNSQFVVQPYNLPGHLTRCSVPIGLTNSTHLFNWETNRISFQSLRGPFSPSPSIGNIISSWPYTDAVPQSGDENVRINLWLFNGNAPRDNQEREIIIKSFQFVPLGAPRPALLRNFNRLPGGHTQFQINTEPDRRYQVEAGANLLDWDILTTFLATNAIMDVSDSTSAALDHRFFRALTLP
jgi:hypothetical protein